MKTKLSNIATIQSGVFAKPGPLGDIIYLQGKHFNENGELLNNLSPDIRDSNINLKHILVSGDVLLIAKGTRNFAVNYQDSLWPAVASTTFLVIRLNFISKISPSFLTWYLNTSEIQSLLKQSATGSAISSITKKAVEDIEIPMPSIEKQRLILNIAKLNSKRNQLALRLAELQNQNLQITLQKAIYQ